jgi:hypothetical protein
MSKNINILLLILLIGNIVFGQNKEEVYVDSVTYSQYLNKDWKSLIHLGKEAHKRDIDFYYLKLRMGVAYYESGKYRKAVKYFEQTLKENPSDVFIQEYLYYSYMFAGRQSEAVKFSKNMNVELKKQRNINFPHILQGVQTEGGYFMNTDYDSKVSLDNDLLEDGDEQYIYATQTVPKDYKYFNFGLTHGVNKSITFFHSYTNLQIQKLQQYHTYEYENDDYGYIKDSAKTINDTAVTTIQHQYYASLNIQLKRGFSIVPAFHYLNTTNTNYIYSYDSITHGQDFSSGTTYLNSYLVYLGLIKQCGLFTIGTSMSYSTLNNKKQLQPGVSLVYYPFGNLNFYTTSNLYYQINKLPGEKGNKESNIIFSQKVGFKVYKVWLEGTAMLGGVSEYNESGGFVVYNSVDKIQQKFEGVLIIPMFKGKIDLSLRYQNIKFTGNITRMKNKTDIYNKDFNYTNNLFIGGLSWKF